MNSLLLWLGGLLVAILALLLAVPYAVDWNTYRGVFEEEATRILGRAVRVDGRVNLRLLPSPYVRFEQVRISDTEAVIGEPFFRARSFTLWLSTPPLLRGAIEVKQIELDGPVLRLAMDAEGRGNWETFSIAPGSVPYVPSDVVLQNVRVRNGTLSLTRSQASQPLVLSGIAGEVSAATLSGPYRFRGIVGWDGTARELRLATATRDAAGGIRFKASVAVPTSGSSYVLDGALSDFSARARLTGELNAKIPLAGQPRPAAAPRASGGEEPPGGNGERPRSPRPPKTSFDLKATLAGNADALSLNDIAIAFEQDGRPQLLSGEASAQWTNGTTLRARLASRWLDLDRIAAAQLGPGAGSAPPHPLAAARHLVARLGELLPDGGNSLVVLDVDQINLGGDAVSDVHLALARTGGLTSIGELRAGLPGNAHAELRGNFASVGGNRVDTDTFDGQIVLHGTSYRRFSQWSLGRLQGQPANQSAETATTAPLDGTFSLSTRLQLRPDSIAMSTAAVEIGDTQLSGDLNWSWGSSSSLRLVLDGSSIDVSGLAPGALGILSARAPGTTGQPEAGPAPPLKALSEQLKRLTGLVGPLDLDIRATRLTDGATVMHDVDAGLKLAPTALAVERLRFTSPDGVAVDLRGNLTALDRSAQGQLNGWITAPDPAAVAMLMASVSAGSGPLAAPSLRRIGRLSLGFAARFGGKVADRFELHAKGTADDSTVSIEASLDGGLEKWRSAGTRFALQVDSPDPVALVRRLAGSAHAPTISTAASPTAPHSSNRSGTLFVTATGATADDMATLIRLDTTGLRTAYTGKSGIGPDGTVELAGELRLDAAALSSALELAGATHFPAVTAPLAGTLDVTRRTGTTVLATRALSIAGIDTAGRIELTRRETGGLTVSGNLGAARTELTALLGLVLDNRAAAGGGPAEPGPSSSSPRAPPEATTATTAATATATPWPDIPFSFATLDGLEGRVTLNTPRLEIATGLAVQDAVISVDLAPGVLRISQLTGKAIGGDLSLASTIERTPAGAIVSINGGITGARLAAAATTTGDTATAGSADIRLSLSGRALSPRAAIAAFTGSGEIRLRDATLAGIAADAVNAAAAELIDASGPLKPELIEQAVRGRMAAGSLPLGNRTLKLQIADGAIRIQSFAAQTASAALTNTTTVDLASLRFDSEWEVRPLRPLAIGRAGKDKPPLPELRAVWTGAIGQLGTLEPRLAVAALERELIVRKMERDVERLEELRRLDEERARQDEERRRREEEEARRGLLPGVSQGSTGPGNTVQGTTGPAPTGQQAPVITAPFAPTTVPTAPRQALQPLQPQQQSQPQSSSATPTPAERKSGDRPRPYARPGQLAPQQPFPLFPQP